MLVRAQIAVTRRKPRRTWRFLWHPVHVGGSPVSACAACFSSAKTGGREEKGRGWCDDRARSAPLPGRLDNRRPVVRFSPAWNGMSLMHAYRTHTCGASPPRRRGGGTARLSGWVHRKRDHGQLLFVDLRDHYGITQCVIDVSSPLFAAVDGLRLESVVVVDRTGRRALGRHGQPEPRTGEVELVIDAIELLSAAEPLPFPVNSDAEYPEEMRLALPLSRSAARAGARQHHAALACHRLDPPAHDRAGLYRVPDADPDRELARGGARLSGAEPAASGQVLCAAAGAAAVQAIADGRRVRPLFPDRAVLPRRGQPRRPLAGRVLPARFRDVVRHAGGRVRGDRAGIARRVRGIRRRPGGDARRRFRASPIADAMLKYGTDKPDLRNPLVIADVVRGVRRLGVPRLPARSSRTAASVRAIPAPGSASRPRSSFQDRMDAWAKAEMAAPGLGYIIFEPGERGPAGRGPIAQQPRARARSRRSARRAGRRRRRCGVFRRRAEAERVQPLAGAARIRIGQELGLDRAEDAFRFCWIIDFPMYERNEETGQIEFSHNPFSMPQGGLEALETQDPLTIIALPVRHRLQRRRAVVGRDPQPSSRHHVQGLRDRRLFGGTRSRRGSAAC